MAGGPGSTAETWPEDPAEVRQIIERFGKAPAEERDKRRVDVSGILSSKNMKLQAELERTREENAQLASLLLWNRTSLEAMDIHTVPEFERGLHTKIKAVNEMIENLVRQDGKPEDQGSQSKMPIKSTCPRYAYSIPSSFKSVVDPILFGHGPDYCSYMDPMSGFLPGTYDSVPSLFLRQKIWIP